MSIEKVHGVILVLEQFVEHVSSIAFRCRLGIGRELIKVDESEIARMGWRWGYRRCIGHKRGSAISIVCERVLRGRDRHKGTKVRVCRALRRLAWPHGGVGDVWEILCGREGRRSRRGGGGEERRKTINVCFVQRRW